MNKMLFVHMNQLGDLLFSLPVLEAARREMKDVRLYSLVKPQLLPLVAATGFIEGTIPRVNGTIGEKLLLVQRIRQERFSQAVYFSESPESLITGYAAGIPRRRGFVTASLRWLLTDTVARSGVPSLGNNRTLGVSLGLRDIAEDYSGLVTVPDETKKKVSNWLTAQGCVLSNIVTIAPGASRRRQEKCWFPERWSALLAQLQAQGFSPVLSGAPSERESLQRIAAVVGVPVPVFVASDGVLSLAGLLSLSKAFIGIDSGAMHLAAAVRTPVVALFGPTDPAQVGPRPLSSHQIIQKSRMEDIQVADVRDGLGKIK